MSLDDAQGRAACGSAQDPSYDAKRPRCALETKRYTRWDDTLTGFGVREAAVLTLNRSYVYDGCRLGLDSLIVIHPVLEEAKALLAHAGESVRGMLAMLEGTEAPHIEPGEQYFAPYPCGYYARCARDIAAPEHSVEEPPRLSAERRTSRLDHRVSPASQPAHAAPMTRVRNPQRVVVLALEPHVR